MFFRSAVLFLFISINHISFAQTIKSPDEFLGFNRGERFTRHHEMVDYFKYVDAQLSNVQVYEYGKTYEDRPLLYTIIASEENFKKLEEIRKDNLIRAGVLPGTPSSSKVAIVWMSYNVHGNEASAMEAAITTLYELCTSAKAKEWLKNTVVIIDPCINPDGRDRYANFNNAFSNTTPNTNGEAAEHREPWPGGRPNHYWFDLNRDWAWLQQKESAARIPVYNQWLPHVHVDFHEQGYNSPYYFAPAAEPYHPVISKWQREFQHTIGKNNAKYFDSNGWLYFTKEVFDLYYPSYGDTYPTYSGAIGMTYEQAGSGYAGLSIQTEEGDPLTLEQRIKHHHTTGLSTVEITAQHATKVVDEFEKYHKENINNPFGTYKTYVIKGNNNPDKLNRLAKWLQHHDIQFGLAGNNKPAKGFNYQNQSVGNVTIESNDIVVNTYQPKSRFITTVFEPQYKVPDSLTYDITAWNLIYAYDLQAYALTERINPTKKFESIQPKLQIGEQVYAYLFRYETIEDVRFVAALQKKNIKVRTAARPFTVNGNSFKAGTIIITQTNNQHIGNFDATIKTLADNYNRSIFSTPTGLVDTGKDFGSYDVVYLPAPKVAMLIGDDVESLNAGEVWHFFEQQIDYPITQIRTTYFKRINLNQYTVLIVPEGYYSLFDEAQLDRLSQWVQTGGKLIVIGDALNSFMDKKGFSIKQFASEDIEKSIEKTEDEIEKKSGTTPYDATERKELSNYIYGAIYKAKVDNTHPLAYGLSDTYYSLKTSNIRVDHLEDGWNVASLGKDVKPLIGFAGYKSNKKQSNTLTFGVEEKGQGKIIYFVDNPLFRCFWEQGKFVFGNAVFIVR
ncbi:MAG: M14 family zinc carboxypeptidase [Cyclobacteriaceae bacterium]|jgi:hypothetical protein|nr:M14 family zinc carboxypeptidase [Cyclobacteriaceae bacterium]